MPRTDLELARAAALGERAAFAELVRRAAPVVSDLIRRMGAQSALADDITQDAMIAAYRSIASYRGEAAFATWTMRIAARLYVKRFRKDARTLVMAEPVDPDIPGPPVETAAQMRLDLDRALSRLPAAERLCVSLCHGGGLTHAEISQALGLPLGTVKSHVTRGLQRLRNLMTETGDSDRMKRHG